ncbi:hypothetical protein HID58_046381 [Brassica napus]|uniref:(rape) hypothetical protein n=1 Tax=Brassica napus TaxID=3708 RepID=A0A816JXA1_BRANA|nr:hypothetical protein HID58_046381 [Brassica napus]CAF1896579.1 unnamed protein product [Brassica napus]
MVDAEQVQLIFGVIGNITNFGLLAYHIPRYIKVVNDGSVGNMQPDFPMVNLLYCAICFMYGLHDDTILLRIVHAQGLDSKLKFLGVTCVIFNIMTAIVAESVKLMPFSLVLFGFINSIVWMAYSLIYKINIYLFICSAIGAFLSASEIVIYALYRHKVKTCKVKSA